MKFLHKLLLASVLLAFVFQHVGAQEAEADGEVAADDTALAVEEKEVEEVVEDIKADEAEVAAAPDEKTVAAEETDVKHDEDILGVQMEDVDEMMADIKDDELDNDADVIERKLDDVKFAKDNNAKTDAERRKLELANKKKRNAARKKKHEDRAKKHADRHKKVDKWIEEMRKEHPPKGKRDAMKELYSALQVEHAKIHSRFFRR